MSDLKIGDYCHAHRWSDKDPQDPWAVGFLAEILITKQSTLYKLKGTGVTNRWYEHCEKITSDQGLALLKRPTRY